MKGQETLFSSKSDEWATPKDFFEMLNDKHDFLCDLAASDENHLLPIYFTKENSAFDNLWFQRNWCNPPYSNIKDWVFEAHKKAVHYDMFTLMLIPARTDTRWFHEVIYKKWHVEFIKGRLKFGDSKNSAPFPSMLVYFGIPA